MWSPKRAREHFVMLAAAATVVLAGSTIYPAQASEPAPAPSTLQPTTHSVWHPWFEIGGYYNSRDEDGTGTSGTNRGETTIFAPLSGNQRTLLFGQVTAKFFEGSAKEGNLALGYRRMTPSGFNLGAWIGGDVRYSAIDNTFWQLSGGFEALSDNIDVRFNWYGPITEPKAGVAGFAQVHLQGNQIFMTGGQEVGLKGVDGEIGFRLPTEYLALDPKTFELRAYAGGYYFDDDDALEKVAGGKGRLEFRVNDVIASLPGSRLTAEYEISRDDVRGTRHEAGLRIRIPFNGDKPVRPLASLSAQQRRMLDGIERDTDIVTARSKSEQVEDALTGTDFDRVAYASAGNSVSRASRIAGDNSLIILNGINTGTQRLRANQTLQGGGATIAVRGQNSGTVVPFTAPGAAGRLRRPGGPNADNLIIAGDNTHISGISIVGRDGTGGGDGVDIGSGKSNVFLTNLNIANANDNAVEINNDNSAIWLINVTTSNSGDSDVSIGNRNTGVGIIGGTFAGANFNAIEINNNNVVALEGVQILNYGNDGIHVFGDRNILQIIGGAIGDGDEDAIELEGNRNTLIVSGLVLRETDYGIAIGGNRNEVSLTDTTFDTITGEALYIDGNTNIIDIVGGLFANIDESIAYIQGNSNTVTLSDLTVSGAGYIIYMTGRRNDVAITDSTFSDIDHDMFRVSDRNNALSVTNSVFNAAGENVFRFEDANGLELFVSGNTFNGPIGGSLFSFENSGTTTVLAGSTGNTYNAGPAPTCQTTGTASFTGDIRFVDGAVVTQQPPPTC